MNNDETLIFVSIAAYRDPQLVPTVLDCLRKAANPHRLRFGICCQSEDQAAPLPFVDDSRFRVIEINWRESKGACWARAEIMKLWDGEDWFFQLDSHCRFAPGWDATLVRMAADTGSGKPVLTTYPNPFTPGENEVLAGDPMRIAFQAFTPDGIPHFRPQHFSQTPCRPVRARFLAAGFLFTRGSFVREVPYDPELYFIGEEAAMTVRAFTHGYDLFHPPETVLWHDYGRPDAKKHWGDHTEPNNAVHSWGKLDQIGKEKVRRLLRGEELERFGLGPARTLEEYEKYAGLSFLERKAQPYTVRGEEPPNPRISANWTDAIDPWIVKIVFRRNLLPEKALDDPLLWFVCIQDENGFEIHRQDLMPEQLSTLKNSGEKIAVVCEFFSATPPASWILWPLSRSQGWLRKVQGRFQIGDFAILKEDEEAAAAN